MLFQPTLPPPACKLIGFAKLIHLSQRKKIAMDYNYGKKKNQTTFERAKKYEDVDQFA